MSKKCVIALKMINETIVKETNVDYIGVDFGALKLAQQHIHMTLAIGDFDSIAENDLDIIKKYSVSVIRLNKIKDDSDSEAAIRYAVKMGYNSIIVYGGLGGRLDHEMVNLRLAEEFPNCVILKNQQNEIMAVQQGEYHFKKQNNEYLSFFALCPTMISVKAVKYPLFYRFLKYQDLYCLSNEIIESEAILTIHSGKIFVVRSKDGR